MSHKPRRALVMVGLVTLASCGKSAGSSTPAQATGSASAPNEFGLSLAELAVRVESTEQLIATCMKQAGFQYVALDFGAVKAAMDSDQTAAGLSSEDFVKQFGLGVTTQFDKPLVVFGAGPQNNDFLNGLGASDQVAFRRELWGETPDWSHVRAIEQEDFSQTGGCTLAAATQTYSPTELSGNYVNPKDKLIQQDPRMVTARQQWTTCMRDAGYEYDEPDQVSEDLTERLKAIVGGQDPKTVTGPTLDALKALQGEELAVAAALTTCEEKTILPVQDAVEAELYGAPQP
jgi:hypothetical protein